MFKLLEKFLKENKKFKVVEALFSKMKFNKKDHIAMEEKSFEKNFTKEK